LLTFKARLRIAATLFRPRLRIDSLPVHFQKFEINEALMKLISLDQVTEKGEEPLKSSPLHSKMMNGLALENRRLEVKLFCSILETNFTKCG
jgi:hypothetical protein